MFTIVFTIISLEMKKFVLQHAVLNRKLLMQLLWFFSALLFFSFQLQAQKKVIKPPKIKKEKKVTTTPYVPGPLFNTEEVLQFKLTGRLRELFNDRAIDRVSYHQMLMQFKKKDSVVVVPLTVKARGHFRRRQENCSMPPLLLNFDKVARLKSTEFEKQDKLKLVTPCKNDDYVIREYLVYKIYNLLSPYSFKARLVQVDFEDSVQKRKNETHYCILIEDEGRLAKRKGMFLWDKKMVFMENLHHDEFIKMAVFQYLIGNTDWSVPYLHNIKLLYKDSSAIPIAVPYDFDHSGIVNASYANPPEQLGLPSVRNRLYRGYCQDKSEFAATIALFNKLKDDIYKLYTSCTLLDAKYIKSTVKYLDEFYKVINTPRETDREFTDPCRKKNNIVIKGYDE
jgi:hypothetical protein